MILCKIFSLEFLCITRAPDFLQLGDLPPKLQLRDGLTSQTAQRLQLPGVDRSRLVVEDAEAAEGKALGID